MGDMKTYLILFCMVICISCESFDNLTICNSLEGEKLEVLFSADQQYASGFQSIDTKDGKSFYQTFLEPGEVVKVGTVNRRYVPEAEDVNVHYIEIRYAGDTVVFNGKKAIYTSFYNEEGKTWRYTVK